MAIKIYADAGSNLFKGIIEKRNADIKIVNMSLTIDERIYNCYEDEIAPLHLFDKWIPACTAVQNLTLTEQTGSIKLDWESSDDAEGYLIYGMRGGGSYGYIGMTSGNNNTTYIDNLASTTQLNRYWVFPFFYEGGAVVPGVQSEEVNGYAH